MAKILFLHLFAHSLISLIMIKKNHEQILISSDIYTLCYNVLLMLLFKWTTYYL